MIRMEPATNDKMCKSLPVFTAGAILFLLCSFTQSCAPRLLLQRPPENYQGPIAEGPILQAEDYWIYQRPDGSRIKVGAGTLLSKVEFPLWVGRVWRFQSTASLEGQPVATRRIPTEIACEAVAFRPVTVAAGTFEAFECQCRCTVTSGRYDPWCGDWTIWYAPQVKNIARMKTESTASSFDLLEYKLSERVSEPPASEKAAKPRSEPNNADAFYSRGRAYYDKKDYDRAIQDYTEALRLNPTHVFAFNNRGNAYLDKKQSDLAIADYDRAIAYDSNYSIAYYNRARAYSAKKDDERALQDYEMAIRINPKYAAALYNRGNIYRAKKDYDRAIKDYDEAIRSNPTYAMAFNNRGIAYREKGDDERAMADYDQAIQLKPDYALAFNNRGNIFRSRGDYDRAIQAYDDAVRLDPNYAVAFGNRGRARFDQGRFGAAAPDLAKAFDLQPSSLYHAVWLYLAETRAGENGRTGLEGRAPRLNLKNWPGPVINFYLGKLDEAAMYAAAEDVDARKRSERICEANFFAAEVKVLKGAVAEAVPLLRAAAEDCPPNLTAKSGARAELKRLGQ